MKAFRFPLERVLAWRRTQVDLEEARMRQHASAVAELDRLRAQLDSEALAAETDLRGRSTLAGEDLAALGSFRAYVRTQGERIAKHRADRERQLAAQQKILVEARRKCRLLERLRERRFQEWQEQSDREVENLAAESHLARLARE